MDLAFSADEEAFAAEVRVWLAAHVEPVPDGGLASPEDEVASGRAFQARLAAARWVGIQWPTEYGGRAATPVQVALYNLEYARAHAPQPLNRVGLNLAGPTLLAWGTERQRQRWLPPILDASELWCQLFSEPGAGSDLASLRTAAIHDDGAGGWRLSGQKVWTSYAPFARWGICLARTAAGITYFVLDMHQPGVDVRPLKQITGEREFSEVFLDGAFVPDENLIGDDGDGWRVAATTLAHERGTSFPFKEQAVHEAYLDELWAMAARRGRLDDADVLDGLTRGWLEVRMLRLHNWRTLTRLARGEQPGPESSLVKLAWTDATQHLSAAALDVVGEEAPVVGPWSRQWLWSRAASIAGGTSEIQRTILGEKVLGLPTQ
ncbi:MAG: acyl-CoA dehydrogenase family protein [Acidimicrobiales bacterium]